MAWQLPVLDGCQATAEIRRPEGTARRTPIIARTAASLQDAQMWLAAGMDDHIAKPVLLAEVQAVLLAGSRTAVSIRTAGRQACQRRPARSSTSAGWPSWADLTRPGTGRRWSAGFSRASWPGSRWILPTSAPPTTTATRPGPFGWRTG
jgi:hypothetical protein